MAKKSKKAVAEAMDVCVPRRYAPRITFTEDDISGLKNLKVGDTHEITIKGKLVKLTQDEYEWDERNDSKLTGTFKIIQADNKDITDNYDDDED